MNILPTQNRDWGFWGACIANGYADDPTALWAAASEGLQRRKGWGPVAARKFLDSRSGRHFADSLSLDDDPGDLDAVREYAASCSWVRRV